jgi:hypothetical protein
MIESLNDVSCLSDEAADDIVASFKMEYGEDAFPVGSLAESREVEFYGKKGIVVANAYRNILAKRMGTIADLQELLRYATEKKYAVSELTDEELSIFNEAVADISLAIPTFTNEKIDIVDFKDERTLGLFSRTTGKIELSKKSLTDISSVRVILVHEVTHMVGEDGSKSHEDAQCYIWSLMFNALKNKMAF